MNKTQFLKNLSRRNFLKNTVIAATGAAVAPSLLVSCADDDAEPFSPAGEFGFLEGVASFDPTQDKVILWSRYTIDANENTTPVIVLDVASDPDFTQIVASQLVQIDAANDNTINVDVESLQSNTKYYYRFRNDFTNTTSVVGETKTLPAKGEATEVKMAVVSCANYRAGLFNVYGAVATSDADVVVHLGDYIYEYGSENDYGTDVNGVSTSALGREHSPDVETISIEDYRARYRQYRSDPQLQTAHRLKPFICVWDDHEITNDAFKDGAENHNEGEGSYEVRKMNALQVWHEYLPARVDDNAKIYRSFDFGGIANLMMLDTRIIGRDEQLNYLNYIDDTGNLDSASFLAAWTDANRTILGSEQKTWLTNQLGSNSSSWQVIGSQVLMAKYYIPAELLAITAQLASGQGSAELLTQYSTIATELATIKGRILQNDPTVTAEERARVETVLPYNLDAWDGYPVERDTILTSASGKKLISLAGDTHNAWYADHSLNGTKVGAEFATSSVSSPGFETLFGNDAATLAGFVQANTLLIDDLKYADASQRGFLLATFSSAEAKAEWNYIGTLAVEDTTITIGNTATEV